MALTPTLVIFVFSFVRIWISSVSLSIASRFTTQNFCVSVALSMHTSFWIRVLIILLKIPINYCLLFFLFVVLLFLLPFAAKLIVYEMPWIMNGRFVIWNLKRCILLLVCVCVMPACLSWSCCFGGMLIIIRFWLESFLLNILLKIKQNDEIIPATSYLCVCLSVPHPPSPP